MTGTTVTFQAPEAISFVLGTILPLLVGLVTKKETNSTTKVALLGLLSLVSSFLTALLTAEQLGTPFNIWNLIFGVVGTWVVGIATHQGVWKPTGAADVVQAVGSTTQGK